jgi:protochlorophyllide reductase
VAADKIKTNIANDSDDAVQAKSVIKQLKLVPAECDLADLKSIDKFVSDWKKTNGESAKFDAVCYNAGVARNTEAKDVLRTAQGFELTVGVNHLGHFYLHHLILPLINKENGRIVVTASSVHDPDSPGGAQGKTATLGDLKGLEDAVASGTGQFDMVDGGNFNADKAYKDSKLCNVLFTRELQRRLDESGSKIKANSFSPGKFLLSKMLTSAARSIL